MSIISLLRDLRHKRLRKLYFIWVLLGRFYRFIIRNFDIKITQFIGSYGPFKMNPEFAFSNYSSWGGQHNRGFDHLISNLKDSKVFFDVGAHIGLVTLPAATTMPTDGLVVAFEPSKTNFNHLKSHLKANNLDSKVDLVKTLVGSNNKNRSFYSNDYENGMNSISPIKKIKGYKFIELNQLSLDSYCERSGNIPQIIKIDVEGAELDVLKGANDLIKRFAPTIYLSVHPKHLKALGIETKELIKYINSIGYVIKDFEDNIVTKLELNEYLLENK